MPQLYALFVVQNAEPVGGHVPEWMLRYIGGCAKKKTPKTRCRLSGWRRGRQAGETAGGRTRSITTCFSGSSE